MKKADVKKLSKLRYKEIKNMNEYEALNVLTEILSTGDRFKSGCMGDHDWWYVVRYVLDVKEKNTLRNFIVVRSYSKQRAKWIYKILSVKELLYVLHLDCES